MTQGMYDSRRFTMAEIIAPCGVTSMTIYRKIRTGAGFGLIVPTLFGSAAGALPGVSPLAQGSST